MIALVLSACAATAASGADAATSATTTVATSTVSGTTTAGEATTATGTTTAGQATTDPGTSTTTGTGTTGSGTTTTPTGPQQVQVQVSPDSVAGPLPAGFLGFSVEFSALHAYLGRNPNALDPVFVALLSGIDQGHPPVLRIGGNSTDDTWLPLPGVIPPQSVNYALTNDWLTTLSALVHTARVRLILGVNLAADDPQIAGAEARALVAAIGRPAIEDLEVGNEPDLYRRAGWYELNGAKVARRVHAYPFGAYAVNFADWRAILPSLPIAGGALATLNWLGSLDPLAAVEPDVSMVTVHRYPLTHCGVSSHAPSYPTMTNLLSSAATEGLAASLAPYAQALHASGRNLRVDELNSASCEGAPGISDSFGSALWITNELFDLAAAGVDGVNVHTLPGSDYAPFVIRDDHGHWTADVRPVYYGMRLFASAFPPGATLLGVSDSSTAAGGDVKAYSTETPAGTLRTTIINEDPTRPATVQLQLPGHGATLTAETLTAPALTATSGVRLGGASFGQTTATGTLGAPQTTRIAGSGGSFTVTVAAASAVLLTGGS